MNTAWKNELVTFSEKILGTTYGTSPFWASAAIAVGTMIIFGWLISNFVMSAKRGIIVSFLAHALPALAAAAGWVAVVLYAVPELNAGAVRDYLPLAGAVLGGFLATLLLTRFLLGISEGGCLMSVILTYACVATAIFLGGTLVREVDSNLDNLEHKKEEREREADSILNY